jgi:hypothetical protein
LINGLRQAKVEDLDRTVRTHFHVGGRQVAMDDAEFVRGVESVGDLAGDVEGLGQTWGLRLGA